MRRSITVVIAVILIVVAVGSCSHLNSERIARALRDRTDYTTIKDMCMGLTGLAADGEVTLRSYDPRVPPLLRSLAPYHYPIDVRSNAVTLRIKNAWRGEYGFGFEVYQTSPIDWDIHFYYKGLVRSDFELDEHGRSIEPSG